MEKKYVFVSREFEAGSFGESSFSKFSIENIDDVISFKHIGGRAPTINEFSSAILETVFNDVTEEIESMPRYAVRSNPYRIVKKTGYSDAEDYFIEESRGGDVVRHHVFHVSMEGKMNIDFRGVYSDDILQVLSALGWMQPERDNNGELHYTPAWCAYDKFVKLQKRTPRNIMAEPGWCNPDGTLIAGTQVIVDIHETRGGYRVPSILSGAVGKFWEESKQEYEEYCRKKSESQIG